MIVYDGTYRLQRRKRRQTIISGRYAPAWRVRIIDFTLSLPEVRHIKPTAVVATSLSDECFKTNCAESIGKRICRDFNLKISNILWFENFEDDPATVYTAAFKPIPSSGFDLWYDINWRLASPNEIKAVGRYIPEIYALS
ncbi:MAG: hypothetical protein JJV92_04915 [Desulfosarcina sp.]|nr:hypothetical protein [Desulfobacterales bacterium]